MIEMEGTAGGKRVLITQITVLNDLWSRGRRELYVEKCDEASLLRPKIARTERRVVVRFNMRYLNSPVKRVSFPAIKFFVSNVVLETSF